MNPPSSPATPPPCPFEKRFPSQLVRDDLFFMTLAYNQAIDAWRKDEVPIGAVIELGGEVIAAAHNTVESAHDPTAHAEMLAITQAASRLGDWRLEGATLYVTKEPCPMCSGATLMSRVRRVCYAVPDPKMGCLGGATNVNDLPRVNHHVELTVGGVLERECRDLLQAFFRLKRQNEDEGVNGGGV
ncbi:nucleoside deaminase [Opitutus sp. ER46]|uniref:nucleoside deaminase n=1 Tax=Opitutus sp. ER46 TaxID=2161864 RepID=UPI000D30F132|nr:nucleoside deaminase [Opitutus sp. ER46]PTX97765.1 tRNA-specific adenosine deaminase [Opitutus sp. ER46]